MSAPVLLSEERMALWDRILRRLGPEMPAPVTAEELAELLRGYRAHLAAREVIEKSIQAHYGLRSHGLTVPELNDWLAAQPKGASDG